MPNTNEKEKITSHLEYIGLNLDNIPEFLLNYQDVDFKPVRTNEDTQFRVYRYLPVKEIQILFTPTNRMDTAFVKYTKAEPIYHYLDQVNEESVIKHATFLKMVENMKPEEIENIAEEQKKLQEQVPFKVKYHNNFVWDIYYSEYTGKYFMMVTLDDLNNSCLFYLLKKQIELWQTDQEEYIFVPINYVDYTRRYLKKSEITDMEKYLWLFTKEWPQIYEVFDKDNELEMHVVGKTIVYDDIQTVYKNKLSTKEETSKFYQLLKALFILQTELPSYYQFDTQIGEQGELIFEYNSKVIDFDSLSKFVQEEYKKHAEELKNIFTEKEKQDVALAKMKEQEREKNLEYVFKEKQVATYLKCKNTVFGRIKYFFKVKNGKFVNTKKKVNTEKEAKENNAMEKSVSKAIIEDKKYYTIEDLLKVCLELDRIQVKIKNASLDIEALEKKIKSIENKIKNANLYLEKIEEHKKSIFEFWRFANKDEAVGLNPGAETEQEEKQEHTLKRTFHYVEDFEDLGMEADKQQRESFSEKECDALYLATTNLLPDINAIKENKEITEGTLTGLKEEAKEEWDLFNSESFDIFGNVKEDKTKITMLANQKHREVAKSKIKLLDITRDATLEEYKDNLTVAEKTIKEAMKKSSAVVDMNIYASGLEKLNNQQIGVFRINPMNAIEEEKDSEKINVYKVSIKEGMHVVYATNIIYYDNHNHTLPLGMNVNDKVIFDMSQYELNVKRQKIFRINQDVDDIHNKTKIICVYEYEVKNA